MSTPVALAVGVAVGALAAYVIGRRRWAAHSAKMLDTAKADYDEQLALARAGKPLVAEFGTANDVDNIRFLYDKRLTLWNTRRDHEWKIYFGAIVLLGAADTAVVTGNLVLTGWWRYAWVGACLLVFTVVFGYERDLQIGNTRDRGAMDQLFNRLCQLVGIDDTLVLEPPKPRSWWSWYGWAFPWQMILLLLAVIVSALVPFAK